MNFIIVSAGIAISVRTTAGGSINVVATASASGTYNAGISIALDDFGTGYSSLGQLSRLKFDKVKIDRSFVASFEDDEKQEKIVRAIIGLGHGLGIVTTAEGIEDKTQFDRLKAMGCEDRADDSVGWPLNGSVKVV